MQIQKRRAVPVLLAAVVSVGVALAVAAPTQAASETFTTPLSGAEEVAPVDTKARGVATFRLSNDRTVLTYGLNVANIEDVLMAHIHLAPAGANGDIVVWLYPSGPPPALLPGRTQGVLATGTITADDLVGPLSGHSLEDLVSALRSGDAYVNVHTSANPGGEIRGQIDQRGHQH